MQWKLVVAMAGAIVMSGLASPSGGARSVGRSDCQQLPAAVQGVYRRADSLDWRLRLQPCAFLITSKAGFEGGGDISVPAGDARAGSIVLSNDGGCRNADQQNLPTTYDYAFDGASLTLSLDTAVNPVDLCTDRANEFAQTWLRTPNGRITVVYDASTVARSRGTFVLSGEASDRGTISLVRAASGRSVAGRLVGSKGALQFTETIARNGTRTWRIVGASSTSLYQRAAGGGRETARVQGARLHVVMTGTIAT